MQKINFQDLPSTSTPINASNLNQIQSNAEVEINKKASKKSFAVSANSSVTLTFSGDNISFLLSGKGHLGNANELWYVCTYGAGTADRTKIHKIYDNNNITHEINGQTLILTNTVNSQYKFTILMLIGSYDDISIS